MLNNDEVNSLNSFHRRNQDGEPVKNNRPTASEADWREKGRRAIEARRNILQSTGFLYALDSEK